MSRASAFVVILRPLNSAMVGLAIIVGVLVTGGYGTVPVPILVLGWLTGFTLSGASMVVNDYFDREIDGVNEPSRPIPSGLVKPVEAIAYTVLLSLAGLVAAYLTGAQAFAVSLLAWAVSVAYSAWGKRTGFPGNLMVAACVSIPFAYGGALSGNLPPSVMFSLLAFLTTAGREVTKGIVDVAGDREKGIRTIAVTSGVVTASRVAALLYASAAATSLLPILLGVVSSWYIPLVAVTDGGLLYGSLRLLRDPSRETSRSVKNQALLWMLCGLAAFAAGSLLK